MKELFKELVDSIFIPFFHKHGEASLFFLVEGQISSMCFKSLYKTIDPMPSKEENELMDYARTLLPKKDEDGLQEAAKIIYTIGTVI